LRISFFPETLNPLQ